MSIQIEQTFRVAAPAEQVWSFLLDPEQVVRCLPGAALEEVADERTFRGAVRVRLGAVQARYRGQVELTEVDPHARVLRLRARGRETGGGTAQAELTSRLRSLPEGGTELLARAEVDLTGRVVQLGRGMIEGVASELFRDFAARVSRSLEAPAEQAGEPGEGRGALEPSEPISLLRVLLAALVAPAARWLRQLLGRSGI